MPRDRLTRNEKKPASRRWRRSIRLSLVIVCWVFTIFMLIGSVAWIGSGVSWRVDLIANLTAQMVFATAALLVVAALLRRWIATALLVLTLIVQFAGLTGGRADRSSSTDDTLVRMLTYNVFNRSDDQSAFVGLLERTSVDVMTIIEPTPFIARHLHGDQGVLEQYPHSEPPRPWSAKPLILSRWPLEPIRLRYRRTSETDPNPGMSPSIAIVHRPGGSFVLVAVHPASPRSRHNWENGNESIKQLAIMITEELAPMGLPIVIGGDFNSTPTGFRSRSLVGTTNLKRAKPLLNFNGTWPDDLPWPARLAIDDAFVSPDIRIADWSVLPPVPGGDHSMVRIDLLIPASSAPLEETPAPPQD